MRNVEAIKYFKEAASRHRHSADAEISAVASNMSRIACEPGRLRRRDEGAEPINASYRQSTRRAARYHLDANHRQSRAAENVVKCWKRSRPVGDMTSHDTPTAARDGYADYTDRFARDAIELYRRESDRPARMRERGLVIITPAHKTVR